MIQPLALITIHKASSWRDLYPFEESSFLWAEIRGRPRRIPNGSSAWNPRGPLWVQDGPLRSAGAQVTHVCFVDWRVMNIVFWLVLIATISVAYDLGTYPARLKNWKQDD